jgi:hypothetical protein
VEEKTMRKCIFLGLLPAALFLSAGAMADPAADQQTKADVAAVKAYLEKTKPGKKWDLGPLRLDSPEIRTAYPQLRFYYVSSTVPGPLITGAAPPPQAVEAHKKASEERMKNFISVTVCIDAQSKVAAVDLNTGLMPIKSDADARVAAAAVLSLLQERDGPIHVPVGPLAAANVKLVKNKEGWKCTIPLPPTKLGFTGTWGGEGEVRILASGQLSGVEKRVSLVAPYNGPYPPSAPK